MTWIDWVVVAVSLIIFETMTSSTFFFFCLAMGFIFAAITACFTNSNWITIAVFIIFSVISISLIRPIFKKIISKSNTVKSNVDAIIGLNVVVTEKIMPFKIGFVKVLGEIWCAKSDVEIDVGEIVNVENVDGVTLVVKKMTNYKNTQ
jgi:membrane protein implicated in regulation of membrane protease activity